MDAPLAGSLMLMVSVVIVMNAGVNIVPPIETSTEYNSLNSSLNDSDDKNLGGATDSDPSKMEYKGDFFQFDHCVIRIVYDDNNRVIDPPSSEWEECEYGALSAADSIFEIFTFQKINPAAEESEPGGDNDNRNP